MDNTKYWENRVNRLIRARLAQIDRIFKEAAEEAARLGVSLNVNTDKPFRFSDYPATKQRIDNLMKEVHDNLQSVVVNGVDGAWKIANDKEDEFCKAVFSGRTLTKEQKQRYFNHSDKAREAFALRKTAGLNLSDRVWRYTEQFKQEIEMGLDLGIGEGRSAADMARDLKRYLREPDKLFRRVRDKRGNLQLSKNAASYHPGAGVYRSSYKNALRLTRTETNMAYRTADQMRYQSLDFVVGIEIHTSNNHPVTDICDELKGKYPKDFKFVGWHPQCRCYVTSILKTEKELEEDTDKILAGEKVSGDSVNTVKDVPDNFKKWVNDNADRITDAQDNGKLPYFLKDNKDYMDSAMPSEKWLFGFDWTPEIQGLTEGQAEDRIMDIILNKKKGKWSDVEAFMDAHPNRREGLIELYKDYYGEDVNYKGFYNLNEYQHKYLNSIMKANPKDLDNIYNGSTGYVATRNYKSINNHLRGIKSFEEQGLSADVVKRDYDTIHSLDKLINDNTLSESIVLHRNVDENFLQGLFGMPSYTDVGDMCSFMQSHIGRRISDQGYCSTSSMMDANAFKKRPVHIKILAPKGTHAFVTDNFDESEVVLGRGQELKLLAAEEKSVNGKQILELVFKAF